MADCGSKNSTFRHLVSAKGPLERTEKRDRRSLERSKDSAGHAKGINRNAGSVGGTEALQVLKPQPDGIKTTERS